jgi:hypothetical protein
LSHGLPPSFTGPGLPECIVRIASMLTMRPTDRISSPRLRSAIPPDRSPAPQALHEPFLAISVWRKAGFFTSQCFHQGLSKAMIKKGDIITTSRNGRMQATPASHGSPAMTKRMAASGGTEQHPQRDLPVPCRLLARL